MNVSVTRPSITKYEIEWATRIAKNNKARWNTIRAHQAFGRNGYDSFTKAI